MKKIIPCGCPLYVQNLINKTSLKILFQVIYKKNSVLQHTNKKHGFVY
jgi:hypothetical protein